LKGEHDTGAEILAIDGSKSEKTGIAVKPNWRSNEGGFSLIEMLVVLFMVALLGASAVPQISDIGESFDRMNSRSLLLQDIKRAQAESLTEGCRGIFTITTDGSGYSFGCDYLTYDTQDPPVADDSSFVRVLPRNITITASQTIIFNSRGQAVDVDDVITTITIQLLYDETGGPQSFASGTLLGTGLFSFS